MRRTLHRLRTEGDGSGREAAAIGLGVFIGCLPIYGLHLAACWGLGKLLGLNRLKMYVAANVSNPFVAPWLLLAELQVGSLLRFGALQSLTIAGVKAAGAGTLTAHLLLGSVVVGATLGVLAAWATRAMLFVPEEQRPFVELVRRASDRYVNASITAWEFARGKLLRDPLYRAIACEGAIATGGTVLDVGCGQGLMLSLLIEARRSALAGDWPSHWPAPPAFERLVGVETRPRIAAIAREAVADAAEIVTGDARVVAMAPARVVLLFDVLHLMSDAEQRTLLRALAARLEPGGILLVREADAASGWRFAAVRHGNRLKAIAAGVRNQQFHFRSAAEWRVLFASLGLHAEERPMGAGTPFGNVLFRVQVAPDVSESTFRRGPPA